ncbi:hypothetical protein LR48_Vigan01g168300 [Vigna angularis]|uniref:Secreted protein n=1 Tax=Phaseolus angularis TaxID=3914 RepID=A0A0L9TNV1_PHAAN|nr:hypothetical protein LR48_Vigan01g168300 [Vigna angularis]
MAENLAKMLTVILVVTAVAMEAQPVDSAFAIPIYHCTLPECIAGYLEEHWKLGLRGRPGGSNNQKEKGRKEKGKREPEKKEDSTGEGPEREPVVEDQVLEGSLQENARTSNFDESKLDVRPSCSTN